MDKIFIEGLQLHSLIGVYEWERNAKQRLFVDLELSVNLDKAALSDRVEDTIHYGEVAQLLEQVAEESSYELLESLANKMIESIFSQYPAKQVRLKLSKPDILDNAQNVAVELVRTQ